MTSETGDFASFERFETGDFASIWAFEFGDFADCRWLRTHNKQFRRSLSSNYREYYHFLLAHTTYSGK